MREEFKLDFMIEILIEIIIVENNDNYQIAEILVFWLKITKVLFQRRMLDLVVIAVSSKDRYDKIQQNKSMYVIGLFGFWFELNKMKNLKVAKLKDDDEDGSEGSDVGVMMVILSCWGVLLPDRQAGQMDEQTFV